MRMLHALANIVQPKWIHKSALFFLCEMLWGMIEQHHLSLYQLPPAIQSSSNQLPNHYNWLLFKMEVTKHHMQFFYLRIQKETSIEVVLPEHRVGGHTLQLQSDCRWDVLLYPKLSLDSDLLVTSLIGSLKRGRSAALHLTKLDLWWLTAWYALQLLKASVPICWSAWLNH